jgi:hypothetical protein
LTCEKWDRDFDFIFAEAFGGGDEQGGRLQIRMMAQQVWDDEVGRVDGAA